MARKTKRDIDPELPQGELEEELTKHTRVKAVAEPSVKGRLKGANTVPSGDVSSGEVTEVVSMTLQINAAAMGWGFKEEALSGTADNWAAILLRDLRYGVPYDELQGEGFHIREDDSLGDPPICDSCQEEEEAA